MSGTNGAATANGESEGLLNRNDRRYDYTRGSNGVAKTAKAQAGWLKQYLSADIDTRWADLVLIACFFISGMIDSGAYNAYGCFVSMQTGNTVFAALGVSNLPISTPRLAWTKSVTSVVSFLVGAFTISGFHRALGARKRWVMSTSFLMQTVLTAIAAYVISSGHADDTPVKKPSSRNMLSSEPPFPWMDLVPIALLSFQASAKVVASRVLDYGALPTIVLTTLYSDLMSDPGLFTDGLLANAQRNRRIGGAIFYFGGAVSGGAFAKSSLGLQGLLYIAAAMKLVIVIVWLLWREKKSDEADED